MTGAGGEGANQHDHPLQPLTARQRRRLARPAAIRFRQLHRRWQQKELNTMDMDRILGAGKQMIGSAKEAIGKLVGDAKLQVDGKADQAAGKVQNAVGNARDTLKR
jgi:uncharacterized protein YjbJ (UPF0337 family)